MAQGRVVFDGTADELTEAAAREIYGADGLKEAFSEANTSTSIRGFTPPPINQIRAEPALVN